MSSAPPGPARPLLLLATSGLLAGAFVLSMGGAASGCGSSNDADPSCALNAEGCGCPSEGATVECAETVSNDFDSVTCRSGTRTCSGGKWGACIGTKMSVQSHPKLRAKGTGPAPCVSNPCDPGCMTFDDVPGDIDAGGAVVPADGGGITIGEGGEAGWVGGSTCTGLQCQVDACSGDYTLTQLTGKVYDPAGKNPLYNVLVYVPNASLAPLVDGVSCDSCVGGSGSPIVSTLTDYTGTFTLRGVPNGTNIPLVIQSGKWRRQITIPSVTKCVSNSTAALTGSDGLNLIRFPKNRSEGNIPRIAFVSGSADPFQCVFKKMGMDVSAATSEVGVPILADGSVNPDRIHYFRGTSSAGQNLNSSLGGGAPSASTLYDTDAHLDRYDAIVLACEGGQYDKGTTITQRLADYAGRGGRLFLTHFSYAYLQFAPAATNFPNVVTSWDHSSGTVSPMTVLINQTFSKGDNFAKWLNQVGASPTTGRLAVQEGRRDLDKVNRTYATPWTYSNKNGSLPAGSKLPAGSSCVASAECESGTCTGGGTPLTGITNGGFESSLTGWSSSGGAVSATTTSPKTGTRMLQLGTGSGWNYVWQTFTAPATGGSLTFSYNLACTDVGWDAAWIGITDNATGTTTWPMNSECSNVGWRTYSQALVAGRSYTMTFYLNEDGYLPRSYFYVDDVAVVSSGTCAAGTATACVSDAGCGSGWSCWNGTCIPPHDTESLMTFNVPVGAAPSAQCGRVVYADFHVSASALSGSSSTFPDGCNGGDLSAQEKALEFMLFDLTACLTPDYVPPATPTYAPVTVSREYVATCPAGSRPIWHFFDWKTVTPGDSSISFSVRTGDTAAATNAMSPLLLATVSGPPITTWTGADVAALFAAQTPKVQNGLRLKVDITLTPTSGGTTAPTLVDWRQSYTCVATE
ncbi:MAG: hypothetical protein JNL79_16985 [Myxococcales bacterium]|nr:hypothetical protein [Myxococcales bacterium]